MRIVLRVRDTEGSNFMGGCLPQSTEKEESSRSVPISDWPLRKPENREGEARQHSAQYASLNSLFYCCLHWEASGMSQLDPCYSIDH